MTILGFTITRSKAGTLEPVSDRGWFRVFESFAGAWQRGTKQTVGNVTTHPAVFACVTLIANDIAKMRLRLVEQKDAAGIWTEAEVPAFSPVLRRPNPWQNRIQFITAWLLSKLVHGNTYVLKAKDGRGVVRALFVLDPQLVRPLVSPAGLVFYELRRDPLSQLPQETLTVPADAIIHDRWNTLFHPLVGLSPIYACGLAAVHGINISESSTRFFEQGARPGGILTAPGKISDTTAATLKAYFEENFGGENAGRVAVVGDGLKYESLAANAKDSELIEQLKWTGEQICSVYHVPPYMVGLGTMPTYNNIEALTQAYYGQALQVLIESLELCLDEGLGLTTGEVTAKRYGTEFDLEDLLRMDTATRMKAASDGLGGGMTYNEVRRRYHNLGPVPGGDQVLAQQQYYSLEALAERDQNKPFAKPDPATPAAPAAPPTPPAEPSAKDIVARAVARWREKVAA